MNPFKHFGLIFLVVLFSCTQEKKKENTFDDTLPAPAATTKRINRITHYTAKHPDALAPSESKGTVRQGYLVNGRLMPFAGPNFIYFDTGSYVNGHAFVNDKVRTAVLDAYAKLEQDLPARKFSLMECSKEGGGRLFPHRTHQNGLSIDFMTPLKKNGNPYYGLDSCGLAHYLLDFDDEGRYKKDTSISIDFNAMAQHLQALDASAKSHGLRIQKVLLKIELKDELFASVKGKKLKGKILFATTLPPLINALHDDHYHVDFEEK